MTGPGDTTLRGGDALEIRGLTARVEGREILRGVDLTVGAGEVHAILGPNGSGKSTLAHVLAGRPGYEVTGGSVSLSGTDLLALSAWQRARAGLFLSPQYPTEVPGVLLEDVLAAAGLPAGAAERLVEETSRVGLAPELIARGLNVDLSGGEKKRLETVQLGVIRPRFAILDELDSGLDVDALAAVARRVEGATTEWGLGVLAITHYDRLLAELHADVIHVFVGGRVVESGGADVLRRVQAEGYAPWVDTAGGGAHDRRLPGQDGPGGGVPGDGLGLDRFP